MSRLLAPKVWTVLTESQFQGSQDWITDLVHRHLNLPWTIANSKKKVIYELYKEDKQTLHEFILESVTIAEEKYQLMLKQIRDFDRRSLKKWVDYDPESYYRYKHRETHKAQVRRRFLVRELRDARWARKNLLNALLNFDKSLLKSCVTIDERLAMQRLQHDREDFNLSTAEQLNEYLKSFEGQLKCKR